MLERWARFAHRRRGRVMLAWVLIFGTLIGLMTQFRGDSSTSFRLPGSEAQEAQDLLASRFPAQAGDTSSLVFEAPGGIAAPDAKAEIQALLASVINLPGIGSVESPFEQQRFVSKDGTIARAVVHWKKRAQDTPSAQIRAYVAVVDAASSPLVRAETGGNIVRTVERPQFGTEFIGFAAAAVILLIAFGSLIAMGLPLGAALFGVGTGFASVSLAANFLEFPSFSSQFAAMIGIGVGIDYSLLVITRFREGLHTGKNVEDSIVLAVTTSGRAVAFAGVVVAVAFLGLYTMGLPFVAALGTEGAMIVVVAVLVALTLTPSAMSLAGTRIDRWRVPLFHSKEGIDPSSNWYRMSAAIQRHPVPYLVVAALVLIGLATPALTMRLSFTDAGNSPEHYHTRRAYDLLAKGFGPGFNGPLLVVADLARGGADQVEAARAAMAASPNVVEVSPASFNPGHDTAVITAIPSTSPQSGPTTDLVHQMRDNLLPAAAGNSGARFLVAGQTAATIDVGDHISERMPILIGSVIGISFLLLMVVFRSVLVAAKAAVMNLLSIGASYGVLVAVFQHGWFGGLIGVQAGPIDPFLPMMLFAILFGLSMDYEVFLISRIREEYLKTHDNATAVSHGLAATARVITAAAAIMVTVFGAFVSGEDRVIKEFGLGMATAIFVDATIVRLVLVPATMELLGDANWWLPRWLDRIIPHLNAEGSGKAAVEGSPAGGK